MAFHGLLRRASSLLGANSSNSTKQTYVDGEIVFSKNNVCVHTPSQFRREGSSVHHPGYLVVRCRHLVKKSGGLEGGVRNECYSIAECPEDLSSSGQVAEPGEVTNTTLTLTWIPNDKLAKNHDLISQLNPDVCGGSSVSRSCSPCRFSDTDSISVSSFCCNTDTPCTASIASKSYEESSTALISSDLSTTEAPTLNIQQKEAKLSDGIVEPVAELPLDFPFDSPKNDELPESPLVEKQSAVSSETCSSLVDELDSPEKDSVTVSPATRCSSASGGGCSASGGSSNDSGGGSTNAACLNGGSKTRKEDDDPDTGVFFESGSSGSCSDLREFVAGALESLTDCPSNRDNMSDMTDSCPSKSISQLQIAEDESQLSQRSCTENSTKEFMLSNGSSSIISNGDNKCAQSAVALPLKENYCEENSAAKDSDLSSGSIKCDADKHNEMANSSRSNDRSLATEEGSTSGCGGEDTSVDSSPEPHIPTYGGIFQADAGDSVWYEGSAESMAYSANLSFPEWSGSISSSWSSSSSSSFIASSAPATQPLAASSSPAAPAALSSAGASLTGSPAQLLGGQARHSKVAIFNVDLGEMRSLRLFFSDGTGSRGQLVIASRESQYKILHFHHAGLDKLAAVFEDWNFLVPPRDNYSILERQRRERQRRSTQSEGEEQLVEGEEAREAEEEGEGQGAFKQFSVCRPSVEASELHPDEGSVRELDAEDWLAYFSADGVIEDDLSLRRRIFLGGLEPQLRSSVWPFLLRCYPYASTFQERQLLNDQNRQLYSDLTARRERMEGPEREEFWRSVQCTVEKDVVRTDRANPCFAGHDNPNLAKMKNILLNFALHRPDIGYTQGMSDIVAPILSEVRCEPDVFWCFTGLMSKTIFVTSPRDHDMEKNLRYLRCLLQLMAPAFYEHINQHQDGQYLLFCHRWILLCFKREFPERSVLSLWEACWSNYQTDYFHLFVAVAVVCVYGTEVTQQQLRPDETLLYFTSLAHHMDAALVIKKARGLLHQFRSLRQVPCGAVGLCELCGPGMWDSGHNPTVLCGGHEQGQQCPADQRGDQHHVSLNEGDHQSIY